MSKLSESTFSSRFITILLLLALSPTFIASADLGTRTTRSGDPSSLEDEEVDPDPTGLEDEDVDPDPNGLEDDEVNPDPTGLSGNSSVSTRGSQGIEDEEVDPDPNGLEDEEVDPDPTGLEDDEVDPDPHGLCEEAINLTLNSTYRGFAGSQPEVFMLDFPAAGIAHLEMTTPGVAGAAMKIGPLSVRCAGLAGLQLSVIDRSPGSRTLAIREPGQYFFRTASQDPGSSQGAYKLSARFVAADALDADVELWESAGLCQEVSDDHGDIRACATAIDSSVTGEIENGWGDDSDFFSFSLKKMVTVRIHTTGGMDTFGELYDQSGLKLESDDDRGEGTNFQIVRTLPPGRYYVRVEGAHGSEGRYALSVEPLGW